MAGQHPLPSTIRIFLADGLPDGIRVVEKSNWTGKAVVASRPQVGEALQRSELQKPGVYVLVGPGEGSDSKIYIGEADDLQHRLKQHATGKDFWTRFIAFSSSDDGLNKAHVRYLESRLVGLAKEANQWEVENGNVPGKPPLSEPDQADAEWFLREMLVLFPLLGVDAFEVAEEEEVSGAGQELFLKERGAEARGAELKDGFLVRKGSKARLEEVDSIHAYMRDLRKQLQDREVLVQEGDKLVFTQDYRFASPSTAAGVLVGGAANGRKAWKAEDGRMLKTIQDARAE
jgi:hypothetical protein